MAARVGPVGLFTLEVPKTDMGLEGLRRLPNFQPRRSTALGLIEQTAVNSQPTVRNGDADLTTYLYDPATVAPVMNINTLRPKITLPKNEPMQLRASLAQGLTELAKLNQATNAIGAITAANNALALGNIDRAEAILGRDLTRQEIANRNVTPILRRDERNKGVAIDIGNQNPNTDSVAANNNPVYGTDTGSQTEREAKSQSQTKRNYDNGAMGANSGGASSSKSNAGVRDPEVAEAKSEASGGGGGGGGGGDDEDDEGADPTLDAVSNPSINMRNNQEVKEYEDGSYRMPIREELQSSQQSAEPISGMSGVSLRKRVLDFIGWARNDIDEQKELGRTGNSMSVPEDMLWTEKRDQARLMPPLTQATEPVSSTRPNGFRQRKMTPEEHRDALQRAERYAAHGRAQIEDARHSADVADDTERFENQHDALAITGGALKKNYIPIGKFLVHKHKLSGGQLSLCYPNGKKLHDFPNTLLTKNMHHHVMSMIDRTVPPKHAKLKPEEGHFISRLKRRVFGTPPSATSLHSRVPLKEQLMIALGEIHAGNDSPKIKMKIKRMLPQLKYVVSPEFLSQIKQKFL